MGHVIQVTNLFHSLSCTGCHVGLSVPFLADSFLNGTTKTTSYSPTTHYTYLRDSTKRNVHLPVEPVLFTAVVAQVLVLVVSAVVSL